MENVKTCGHVDKKNKINIQIHRTALITKSQRLSLQRIASNDS